MDKLIDAKISIVMPVFNEEEIISRTIEECRDEILKHFAQGEIIVIDDCSTDGTSAVLKQLEKCIAELKTVKNPVNSGHGPSLLKALTLADGDYIFAIDSDYQHRPQEFWKLFTEIKDVDIATGLRSQRRDDYHRLIISKIANFLARTFFACPWQDLNIPFKLFSHKGLKKLLPLIPENSLIPSIMIMVTAARTGARVSQVEVTHLPRTTGQCSLPGRRLILFCGRALAELIIFRCTKWRRISPYFLSTP